MSSKVKMSYCFIFLLYDVAMLLTKFETCLYDGEKATSNMLRNTFKYTAMHIKLFKKLVNHPAFFRVKFVDIIKKKQNLVCG